MPQLGAGECYRLIGPVDIGAVLPLLDRLPFFGAGRSSPQKYQCDVVTSAQFPPELWALVSSLGLGGELARAVLRRLAPRQSIPAHIDQWMPQEADWHRFQVPLVSDPSVIMRWPDDGVELHLAPGNLYEVKFDRTHEVVNPWDGQRIHLQIDQVGATI